MPKKRLTDENWRKDPWCRALCSAVHSCSSEEEVADLLRDLTTLGELQALSERLEVAKQLSRGLTYRQVAANTGASTTTVTRVARFLEGGRGYRRLLKLSEAALRESPVRTAGNIQSSLVQKYLQKEKKEVSASS